MTVADLIHYLSQIESPDTTEVVLSDADFEGTGDYVSLSFVLSEADGDG